MVVLTGMWKMHTSRSETARARKYLWERTQISRLMMYG